jgi:glycosyltransferase involved in cell wall biosynthesis
LGVISRLVDIYRSQRPDLVHHVAMKPVLYGTLAAKLCRISRVVNALAGMGWLFASKDGGARALQPSVRLAFRLLLGQSKIIVQNPDDRRTLARTGLSADEVLMIRGSGVDTRVFSPVPEAAGIPLVVLPARMLWDKGVHEFVEAARIIKGKAIEATFALVGIPDPENPASVAESTLIDWHNEGIVEWWGYRKDMPSVFQRAHVVCLPSYYGEGLPKSLLEGASSGRPIVTTDAPGCREIVQEGENGFLVPIRDACALAKAIEALIVHPAMRQCMGESGRRLVESEFSVEKVIDSTLALYRELLT